MRYDTGNPVEPNGSSDSRDLFDNAANFDLALNGDDDQWPDRRGTARLSWEGLENKFYQFLLNSGFELPPLLYVDGASLVVDRPTQLIERSGNLYSVKLPSSFPVTLTGTWATDQTKLVVRSDQSLRQQLAAIDGGKLIGHMQPGRTAYDHDLERKSIADYGAKTSLSDNLATINAAIAACVRGESLYVPSGIFAVSAIPPNSKGVRFYGPGQIVAPIPLSQINTYRYQFPIGINREYMWRAWQVIQNTARAIRVFTYGDSTVEGGYTYIDPDWFLQELLPDIASQIGIRNGFTVTNRGVGGSSITDWNPLPDVGTSGADIMFVKYGINDAFASGDRLTTFETALRTKLQQIRQQTGGDIGSLAIVLVGPNSVYDVEFDARNYRWFEQLRSIYEAAARDFKCVYVDPYAYLQDSSWAADLWLDKQPAGTALHPKNIGQNWIWGMVMRYCFPREEMLRYASNSFQNKSSYYGWPAANFALYPNNYDAGLTIEVANISGGWPISGLLITLKSAEGPMEQRLIPLGVSGATLVRRADVSGNFFGGWYGLGTTLTLQNGWTNFGTPYGNAAVKLTAEDLVVLDGLIRPGTTAAGTLLFNLPANMWPANQKIVAAIADTGPIQLHVFANGQVQLKTGTPVPGQWINLSGLSFSR
ncbi:SGNH/GDSL hydrolase family protein [Pseudomonas nitroreducens]|uniref:SGNH/GDSL hydrolase family protein n=1 Tax=Pseudomonas nitroreducens TaxID=46680 RepID=UPI002D7F1C03|nr:SGNH/GDSL hydrolase family protein [Pseudomonas nitroreducens]